MNNNVLYKLGFMAKLAELDKSALSDSGLKALRDYQKKEEARRGVPTRKNSKPATGVLGSLKNKGERALDYLKSTGKGLASAAGVTGLRTIQNGISALTWVPALGDEWLFGKLMGVDEGRGFLGRALGKMNRGFDRRVHALRKSVEDYDYAHNINNKLNRFMNGAVADAAGGFIGYGGLGGLVGKKVLGKVVAPRNSKALDKVLRTAGGGFGALGALFFGSEKELRDREAMIRALNPRDRMYIDPTSTLTNQMNAPTPDEYRRYHMPAMSDLPTSSTGYINVPKRWLYTSRGTPIQTQDFGT